jgi:peptidoglycan/LPS O-acetylase OafA/YrhL
MERAVADEGRAQLPERNLDVLRAIAVSCVLFSHLLTVWNVRLPWYVREKTGRLGVLLFFVHTSLVLMSSLERQGTMRRDWVQAFYIRRAFRIYPLAILTTLLVVGLSIPEHITTPAVAPTAFTWRTLLTNLSLTQNLTGDPNVLGVLWSLPIEVQMYLVLPLCFLLARRGSRAMAAMLAAFVLLGLFVIDVQMRGVWRLSMLGYAPCFGGGVLAYHLMRRGVRPRLPAALWVPAIGAVALLNFALNPTFSHPELGWLPCLLLGALIPLFRDAERNQATVAARKLCDVSYGLYLLHEPILWFSFVVIATLPFVAQWATCIGLLVVVPLLVYRFIERPGIRLGQAIAQTRVPEVAVVGAP